MFCGAFVGAFLGWECRGTSRITLNNTLLLFGLLHTLLLVSETSFPRFCGDPQEIIPSSSSPSMKGI